MSWFSELAGKAENLLINIDEQTGAAFRNQRGAKINKKCDRSEPSASPPWLQKKRPIPRPVRNVPNKKPIELQSTPSQPTSPKKSHSRHFKSKSPISSMYNLNNFPRTAVQDNKDSDENGQPYGYKPRRFSYPSDIDGISHECLAYRLENLDVENAMLKNELNVTNREIKEMLDRLLKTEEELNLAKVKLEDTQTDVEAMNIDKEALMLDIEQLKSHISTINNKHDIEVQKFTEHIHQLESEISSLKAKNMELEELTKAINEKAEEIENQRNKAELDLRHAQSTIKILQADLHKSNDECKRLDKDWEAYKHRVKSMLAAKDREIMTLQQGMNFTEDTKVLMEQIDSLKAERQVLSEAVNRVRNECGDMKGYVETLENRHTTGERLVKALRDALKEERVSRAKAEAQCINLANDLKEIQIESGQTIVSLRTALRDKEEQMHRLANSTSTMQSSNSSALNVADYAVSRESVDTDKLQALTQKLVQKQGKIDMLLADNNCMKIQLEKLESKRKLTESQSPRKDTSVGPPSHSVINFANDRRSRVNTHSSLSPCQKVSNWLGAFFRRYPVFRVLIVVYVICLHIWVSTVLLNHTPETKYFIN